MTPQYVTVIMPKYDSANDVLIISRVPENEFLVKGMCELILKKLENDKRNAPND